MTSGALPFRIDRGSHGSYRPLCVLTFRLNHLLGGLEPWGYHLVNVALHAACTVLVVRVARKVNCGIIRLMKLIKPGRTI